MGIKIFALVVWAIVLASVIAVIVLLGGLPGKVAEKRGHPNKNAIKIGGWATLLLAPPGWPFVLMWAYTTPAPARVQLVDDELKRLREENEQLRRKLEEAQP